MQENKWLTLARARIRKAEPLDLDPIHALLHIDSVSPSVEAIDETAHR
jgi:hypothetical protein